MKQFWAGVMEWKTAAAMLFSGSVVLYAIIQHIFGGEAIPIAAVASLLLVSSLGAFLQFLAFGHKIIKHLRYTLRMIVFVVPFFLLLTANAYYFYWFPMESAYWWLFTGIFLVIFLVMTIGFEVYYRAMGRKYDGLLGQYRRNREAGGNPPTA